jgi:predicted TIM-barrel fold metal-dependent hydrolase
MKALRFLSILLVFACFSGLPLCAQTAPQPAAPKIIDAHVHNNGDVAFMQKLVQKLESVDGMAFLLTTPQDYTPAVRDYMAQHTNRLIGFGDIKLDDADVLQQIDMFHAAGFRGLGEISSPLKNYDDHSYSPIYERAQRHGMLLLFHTGIVNRPDPTIAADISVDRMRPTTLDNIVRRFPQVTVIGAHLGNPDYAWAAEIARWNPNLYFDVSGTTLIKKQNDYTFFKSIFWWSGVVSPHTPKTNATAWEKLVFGSDVFNGELEEFDREVERYHKMLDACGVSPQEQANIFSGTLWRILQSRR